MGLIIGIIAVVLVIILVVGVAIWVLTKDDSDSDAGSPTTPAVPFQGSDPAAGTNPSQGTAPGNGNGGLGDMKERVVASCKEQINSKWSNATISNEKYAQPEINANGEKHVCTGIVTGKDTTTNETGRWSFECKGYYLKSINDFTTPLTYQNAEPIQS